MTSVANKVAIDALAETLKTQKTRFSPEGERRISLIGFLNAVLDLQGERAIREVSLKTPGQPPDIAVHKQTILDIKAVDNRGVSFLAEMQVEKKYAMNKRAQYYSAKAPAHSFQSTIYTTGLEPPAAHPPESEYIQ